jgi:hypothetical protein
MQHAARSAVGDAARRAAADNVEVAREALHRLRPSHVTVLGPATPELLAQAVQYEEAAAVAEQCGAAATLQLPELTVEQLEAEVDATNSVEVVTSIQAEYSARQADRKARLAVVEAELTALEEE